MLESFKVLGLSDTCSQTDVLHAWRRLAREHHSDKTGAQDDSAMQALNAAKEECLEATIERDYAVSEHEFVRHILQVLDRSLADLHLDLLEHGAFLVQPNLRTHFWTRTVDAMEWILRCGMGGMPFEQDREDELPILCRYYNDFIGEDGWREDEHTMMKVLNKYDKIKAGGYGNFARFLE